MVLTDKYSKYHKATRWLELSERLVFAMNGINYAGIFNGDKSVNGSTQFKGKFTGNKKETSSNKFRNEDTVEINGQSREIPKAGYDRPKAVIRQTADNELYKKLDENGIQEGIELSEGAKNILEELREKYKNMDIKVLNWSSDEEQEYYASRTNKDYSVLIAPEALEAMAKDEAEKEKYMSVLDNAGNASETLKQELGEDADKIESFTISIDKDGKVSYAVQLIKDFAERNKTNVKSQKERIEQAREEKAKLEEKQKLRDKDKVETIKADSLEELVSKIKEKLYPVENSVEEETEE